MRFFPYGIAVAFVGLMFGMLLWQRIVYYSWTAMGMFRTAGPDPVEIRRKGFRFLVCGGGAWFVALTSCALAVALHSGPASAWLYILGGAALVPVMVLPNAIRGLNKLVRVKTAQAPR